MVINEQIRRYNEKMEEIEQLEYAEALAVNQLKLKRQNTVRHETLVTRRRYLSTIEPLKHLFLHCSSALCLDGKKKKKITF